MPTARQIEANRRNAQRSTGPRTAEGKDRARYNAFKHGLAANTLLPHEDPAEYHQMRASLIEAWQPANAQELLEVDNITMGWFSGTDVNRAVHLAGGWFDASLGKGTSSYSVEMWFWNGLPNDVRTTTAQLITVGKDDLLIGGKGTSAGKLLFCGTAGAAEVKPKTWNYLALVRDGRSVRVYLNGRLDVTADAPPDPDERFLVGGRQGASETLEGKIDEIAIYSRPLSSSEIARRYKASGLQVAVEP